MKKTTIYLKIATYILKHTKLFTSDLMSLNSTLEPGAGQSTFWGAVWSTTSGSLWPLKIYEITKLSLK